MIPGPRPPDAWAHLPFFTDSWPDLAARLDADPGRILPPRHQIFAALDGLAPDHVRVIILGQDPYPTPGHAHGLAFSTEPDVTPLPRSLSNIYKELHDDLGVTRHTGDLRDWASQGVLLLNTALSVPAGDAGGHAKLGWHRLTHQVLNALNDAPRAALLWGKHAQGFAPLLSNPGHLILASAHPSPLSARRGFFGSRPFSQVNDWLTKQGTPPIDWSET